jgi:hypothetical protein
MKLVKKLVCAVLFASALSVSAYAGDMETPGYVPPPPSQSMSQPGAAAETSCVSSEPCENAAKPSEELFYDALMALISLL